MLINKTDKNIVASLLAFEVSFCLMFFIFISLFKEPQYYSTKVIIISFAIVLFWLILMLFSMKGKFHLCYFGILLLFLFVSLYIIRVVWFSSYLGLFPELSFFKGLNRPDTFYHSTLCEAIKNFGHPSLLQGGIALHKYHCLSHFIMAFVSKVFKLPCLISYNYIYPMLFLPLFVYLFFQASGALSERLVNKRFFSVVDLVFSIFIFIGFLPIKYSNTVGIWWNDIFLSESYCVSLVFLLIYFILIDKIEKTKYGNSLSCFLITSIFLFIITASKVSTGVIFFILLLWIYIRVKGVRISSLLFASFIGVLLLFCLSLVLRENENIFKKMEINWFHFIKTYIDYEYQISHIFFILFPSLLLFFLTKKTTPYKEYCRNKISILAEASIICSCCGLLPSVLLSIYGGSAAYFFLPAIFISLFFLFCSHEVQKRFVSLGMGVKILVSLLVLITYGESCIKYISPYDIMAKTCKDKQETSRVVDEPFYNTLSAINRLTEGKKKNYCLFLSSDCEIFNLFGQGYMGLSAITAYLGMPLIEVLDENQLISDEILIQRAKEKHFSNVILLKSDKYRIIK